MDQAVAIVQSYLHVNGYFTVAEYPVLEAFRGGQARSVTDLDILAFRFPGAGHNVIRGRGHHSTSGPLFEPDSALGCPSDRADMIVGEVKEGRAGFNAATRDAHVLEVALGRFGCCHAGDAAHVAQKLLSQGRADTPSGHAVRMVAFGSSPDTEETRSWHTVSMVHVVGFLREYLREHWDELRHAQIKDPAFGFLAMLEKWGGGTDGAEHRRP